MGRSRNKFRGSSLGCWAGCAYPYYVWFTANIGDVISPKHNFFIALSLVALLLLLMAACGMAPAPQQAAQGQTAQEQAAQEQTSAEGARARENAAEPENGGTGRRHRHRNRKHGRGGNPDGPADRKLSNVTGNFDFYLLSLSWSPGFCATPAGANDPGQCAPGRKFSFVLHGLWPQYEQSGWPEDCSNEPIDPASVQKMIAIMPSEKLIEHEWSKHGTCSGLSAKDYFDEADEAFHSIRIPAPYASLPRALTVSPAEIRSQFAAANPGGGEAEFVVECSGNGRYLTEVHACLDKDLTGRACNREELSHECRSDGVLMRPVR